MKKNNMMGYAGYCKGCGQLTAAVMDIPGYEKETIIGLALSFMDGLEIRRATLDEIGMNLRSCQCGRNGQVQPGKPAFGALPGRLESALCSPGMTPAGSKDTSLRENAFSVMRDCADRPSPPFSQARCA
jgi:hypothetical protein